MSRRTDTQVYRAWMNMRQRCNNPNHPDYPYYGGRGIKICSRWEIFENFYADMGEPLPGLTLERKRNNEGYNPDNCIWETRQKQSANRRNICLIIYKGEEFNRAELARKLNVPKATLQYRYEHGLME